MATTGVKCMIIVMHNIHFSDKEWINIFKQYLNEWTEIPLTESSGYDFDKLKFHDDCIGLLLKQTEYFMKEYPDSLDMSFVNSWKYQSKLYRIIHARRIENSKTKSGYSCRLPK